MGSPLGPTLANAFHVHFEKNWLQNCPSDFKPYYYRRYVDDISVLLTSSLPKFSKWSFTTESEKQNRMSFLDVQIICEEKTFTTSVNHKPTFSGVLHILTAFNHLPISLVPSTYTFVYMLAYICLRIYSSSTKLHNELVCLKEIFFKSGYPEDFINKCFRKFMGDIHLVKETNLIVEKKPLVLVLPYLVQYPYKLGLS